LLGTVLSDRYRIDALVGEGAMGRVYRAEHVLMRKRVAVKVLHQQLTAVPEIVQRFEREARAAAHIEHPHVAAGTDFGKLPDGSVFLVLEYVEGRSLAALIEDGPVPAVRALKIALQISSALEAAHTRGIVHRDLKPDNVLLVQSEGAGDFSKVLDFGIAKMPPEPTTDGKPITQIGMVYGTPEYMAPEQALGQDVDGRADLYALGVVLYEMLAGARPYTGAAVGLLGQQLTKPLPLIQERAGVKVPPKVENLVRDLLVTDLQKRLPSAAAARVRIEALLAEAAAGTLERSGERSRLSISLEEVGGRIERAARSLPQPISRVVRSRRSRAAMLGLAFGAVGVVAAIVAVGAFAQGDAPPVLAVVDPPAAFDVDAPVEDALAKEIAAAEKQGAPGLAALAQKYPTQAQVHKKLAYALAVAGKYVEAVDAARVALALDPALNEDAELGGALYRAAQSKEASAAAFRLLKGAMGSEGANVIYALYEAPTAGAVAKFEASKFLRSEEAKSLAEPALLLALELPEAKDCQVAARLVKRAALVGDSRALPALEKMRKEVGCGTSAERDCYPCLRGAPDLDLAVDTIKKRSSLSEADGTASDQP